MSSAAWSLQQAIYAALSGDASLAALVQGVHDQAPEDAPLPYLQIGEATISDWSAKGVTGEEHSLTIHIWSDARGQGEAKRIMGAVHTVLHEADLVLSGHRLVLLRFLASELLRDIDGGVLHGVMRFRALTESL